MITCEISNCDYRSCCQDYAKRLLEKVNEIILQNELAEQHSKNKIREDLKLLEKGIIYG